MARHSTRRRAAFTLVELLVVIGIIGLLISILLPSLNKARAAAASAACLSNLRQMSLAYNMYASENRDLLVPRTGYTSPIQDTLNGLTGKQRYEWYYYAVEAPSGAQEFSFQRGLLGRYLKTEQVIECPTIASLELRSYGNSKYVKTTYGMAQNGGNVIVKRIGQVMRSSETIIFGDAIQVYGDGIERPLGQLFPPTNGAAGSDNFHGRHSGYGNASFVDGHAEATLVQIRPKSSYAYMTDDVYARIVRFHVGPPTPVTIAPADMASYALYSHACTTSLNYWFWANKMTRDYMN